MLVSEGIKRKTTHRKETYKKKILIVEDDVIIADLIKEILEREGFEVEVASDGMEGLEKIKQNGYDVIISDLNMPGMSGSELYLEVRELSPDLAKRIIFTSEIVTDFIESTGNRFLKKPFRPQRLVDMIKEFILSDM